MGNSAPSSTSHQISKKPTNSITQKSDENPLQPAFNLPKLSEESNLLKNDDIDFLSRALPGPEWRVEWKLLFSSIKHGRSFTKFCFQIQGEGPNLIIIKDEGGHIFGGFADSWKEKSSKFYGDSEKILSSKTHTFISHTFYLKLIAKSFLFQLNPGKKIYRPTGYNDHYQYLNIGSTAFFNGVGQGGQLDFFGWCIDSSFEKGHCKGNPNSTFGNPPLSSQEEFLIDSVEVWQVKEPEYSYELEKIRARKTKDASVLEDEGNVEKVLTKLMGHNFSDEKQIVHEDENEEKGKISIPNMLGNSFGNTNSSISEK